MYRAIIRDGDDLAMEVAGKAIVPLDYAGGDSWKLRPDPSQVVVFDRSEVGLVTGYHVGDNQEFRFEPSAELPDIDEVAEKVQSTHRIDLLDSLGPIRIETNSEYIKLKMNVEASTLLAWPDRYRVDVSHQGQSESVAYDGQNLRTVSSAKPLQVVEERNAKLMRNANELAIFGDWSHWFTKLQVIQEVTRGEEQTIVVVRAGDTSEPATTLYIHKESGRVMMVNSMTYIEGMGRIGQRVKYDDYRDVSGMLLPFQAEIRIANNLIGIIVTTTTDYELGVEISEGTFELSDSDNIEK